MEFDAHMIQVVMNVATMLATAGSWWNWNVTRQFRETHLTIKEQTTLLDKKLDNLSSRLDDHILMNARLHAEIDVRLNSTITTVAVHDSNISDIKASLNVIASDIKQLPSAFVELIKNHNK